MRETYDLWEAYDNAKEARLERLPKCAICGQPIQQEYAVMIQNDLFCDNCIDEMKVPVDDD